jgi:glycosyltransferase involved in cell wall biosynthesis
MKIILFANTDWYLYNYRLPLARALRARGDEVVLLSPPGRYGELLEKDGFRWVVFPLARKGMNPLAEVATIFRLWRLLRQEKPDLLHNFTIKPVLYGSLAARLAGVRQIVNAVPGLGIAFAEGQGFLRLIVTTLYRLSLGRTQVIFQNPADRQVFLDRKLISAAQAHLVPGSGVDGEIFHPSPEPAGEPVVLLAGRLLRSKGVPEFVETARRLRGEGIRARFVIAGEPYPDNPDSIEPEELVAWEKEGLIENWGWHDDMAAVIPQAAIICLPTRYNEGLPRLLVEAGACGRPVVATDIPGCRMILRDGENGLMVPPGDLPALVEALKTLLLSPALRERMGKRGREIVEQEFSVAHVIAQTLEVYTQGGCG